MNFPSLCGMWMNLDLGPFMQIRMILCLVCLLAPAIAMSIAMLLLRVAVDMLVQLKAAQSSLRLNGHVMLCWAVLQLWQLMNRFLLHWMLAVLLGKPMQSGMLLSWRGTALASPLDGPMILNRMLVSVGLFVRFSS